MKIGITCYPTYGGSGIVATELGLELADRGHEVHFISYANPIRLDPGTPRIHYHEVEVSSYPLFQYPPYCLALASRMAAPIACPEPRAGSTTILDAMERACSGAKPRDSSIRGISAR